MNDFIETIKGKSYSIEEAKQIFIDYTLRHKGIIKASSNNGKTTFEIVLKK